jgi:hypothetical protein
MRHGVPSYGEHFRLDTRLPYDTTSDLASRRYVLKANASVFIRSTRDSEHWTVFVAGPAGAAFPQGKPYDTLTAAMPAAIEVGKTIGSA